MNYRQRTPMADSPDAILDPGDNSDVESERGFDTGPPRWVKLFGIIAFAVVLLFAILLLTGGGGHGPGRHTGGSGETQSSSNAEYTSSAGAHAP